jgi:tetratricopeptide (TPR) repeat protein
MRIFFISVIFILISTGINASEIDSILNEANTYYQSENFEMAVQSYKLLVGKGYASATLYYNIGNAYYKTGDYVNAVLYYEKAKLLDPKNEDILHNLELANLHIVDKIEVIPVIFYKKWINDLIRSFSSNTWAIISISFFIGTLILFLLFFFSGNIIVKKTGFWLGLFFIFISILSFTFSGSRKRMITDNNTAILISPTVTVKSSPSVTGKDLFIIHEGVKVLITDKIGDWNEIKLSDGKQGWLLTKDLAEI